MRLLAQPLPVHLGVHLQQHRTEPCGCILLRDSRGSSWGRCWGCPLWYFIILLMLWFGQRCYICVPV